MTRAKKARSAFRGGQGRVPWRPMPREGVVATMRVRGGRGGGIGVGGGDMVGGEEWRWENECGYLIQLVLGFMIASMYPHYFRAHHPPP